MGVIYKITSPSGRVYIGQTKNFINRIRSYKNLSCKTQPKLYNSLLKYGFDNHIIEIIDESETDLDKLEIFYINKFNSFYEGLNCTIGGDGSLMCGELNISKTPDVIKKISYSKLEFYKDNQAPMYGRKHKSESIEIIKEKRKSQLYWRHQPVLDLEYGIYYESIKELSMLLQLDYKSFHYKISKNKYSSRYIVCK
jgi:group I intron endonuclease